MIRILFCNISYLPYYNTRLDRVAPKNGGAYVAKMHDAYEKHNFEECADGQYRGFVEIILSKYYDADDKPVYELFGGFRDFGDDEVVSTKRKYWIGNDRFLLDEDKDGSYLQGIYEMIMSY